MVVAGQFNLQVSPAAMLRRHHPVLGSSAKVSTATRLPGSLFRARSSKSRRICRVVCCAAGSSYSSEWNWNRWSQCFSEIDEAESRLSVLKSQLMEAIREEEFEEAAKLKQAIEEAASEDTVAEVLSQLKSAVKEERYQDASRLHRIAGTGLLGWWVGMPKDSGNPFGRIVRITPGVGRYIGRSYSPRQLMTGSPGSPLFEIFLVKGLDEGYIMQVVYMKPSKAKAKLPNLTQSNQADHPQASDGETVPLEDGINSGNVTEIDSSTLNNNVKAKEASEEEINSVISFLKERIPGLKVKVTNIEIMEETKEDGNSFEESILVEEDNEIVSSENSDDDVQNSDVDTQNSDDEAIKLDEEALRLEADEDATEGTDKPIKLFIGGVLNNKEDIMPKTYIRVPAEVKNMERDSFILHVPGQDNDPEITGNKASKLKVAAIAAQGLSELMPADVARALLSTQKIPKKISKDVREIVKLALSQAEMRNILSTDTNFSRITFTRDSVDPFDGLYVGAFGPYGTELIQLRRRFGHWFEADNLDEVSDMEFFEYVEAVKLTGDLNVPAGKVTFRAKVGKGSRLENRGKYPEELGVIASYKGQGRIAEPGFRNPQWVDGELLHLSGKGLGQHVRGAELGFLYVVPGHSFLVLFDRFELPE